MLYKVFEIMKDNTFDHIKEIILFLRDKEIQCGIGYFYPQFIKQNFLRILLVDDLQLTKDIEKRFVKMEKDKNIIEEIKAEVNDDYSDDSLFNISSWGADLSFREICSMYEEEELVKPELQRKYVWDRSEASRFIESILMGLPVPSVFFAQHGSQKLIVDGYPRRIFNR